VLLQHAFALVGRHGYPETISNSGDSREVIDNMAYCPQCKSEIPLAAVVCESCGYDFPSQSDGRSNSNREGLAYSTLADIALIVSMLAASIGCIGAVFAGLAWLLQGDLLSGLVLAPLAFFLQLGMLVVFIRVQDR